MDFTQWLHDYTTLSYMGHGYRFYAGKHLTISQLLKIFNSQHTEIEP